MKITSDGQITLPLEIRHQLGLLPGTEVELEVVGDTVYLRKSLDASRGDRLIKLMQGQAKTKLSTDEIMAQSRRD
ncbi:MAG: AbrB/MazE/SpoVT family DNA-binding domain-containing protein [Leptolyngbyaceae cyanobacterium RM2_2_4]|nr:AbrB/MazE/SpoVT family DNA-binding domain-containing protein [Leptolyngbyaceae cyanobacterium RM2_2_4]